MKNTIEMKVDISNNTCTSSLVECLFIFTNYVIVGETQFMHKKDRNKT
jgi:hypothetical protein